MRRSKFLRTRRAFTLIELLVVIAILAILVAILLPAIAEARVIGRKVQCEGNMKQFGIAAANYATDFQDRIFSFTWKGGQLNELGAVPGTDNEAAAHQAVWILQNRADRPDIGIITGWIPHVLYSHLVLNDYLQPPKVTAKMEIGLRRFAGIREDLERIKAATADRYVETMREKMFGKREQSHEE